ncbi:THUMP domain-containing class I SAM-dependent RNA methyltransferase [Dehalobacterium formicoaceticum]|uniref:Class I SAM-dependent RNA methyltransferase n=1 Tax=Dehalobacterium formicoaceticum TaxID=51515 RepID=A0ABT1Y0E5_9FIRM|nr:class I SAM-dependent RNA methyltransferase [Dehalobacterium formicoaceticum]MCR6544333.1 class I SAM-dependent RNA methyltransferase [Dehalobacterium formicoaceticum]
MDKIEIIATATFGLEAVVADELKNLGYENLKVENGRVSFAAGMEALCRCNLWLRTADRVRVKIGEFKAETFDELFEQTKALPWHDWLPADAEFPVTGKSVKSKLFSVSDCQAIVKKAVVEKMKQKYQVSWFEENGPLYPIEVALLNDTATLTIDTSGSGLHKRGYRVTGSYAPLKETLAAALVLLSRWRPDTELIDPLCGSGTIPIEAALIGQNIAPGMNREFISEHWPVITRKDWRNARKETHDAAHFDLPLHIRGTDIDEHVLKIARENSTEAGFEDQIHFQRMPLAELSSAKKYGKIICNPPYGERLGSMEEITALYREMGQVFTKLDTWSFYILTAYEGFEKLFGKRASKKRKLYNGDIKVDYYQYFGPRLPRKKEGLPAAGDL